MEQSTSASFIRPATAQDAGRIAEIPVFNNRLNFFPIFKDEQYSFCEMQVVSGPAACGKPGCARPHLCLG